MDTSSEQELQHAGIRRPAHPVDSKNPCVMIYRSGLCMTYASKPHLPICVRLNNLCCPNLGLYGTCEASLDPKDDHCPVDLYYFDQLGRQSDRIRLTVRQAL
eukprot:4803898-Amphidinium_carterae.1